MTKASFLGTLVRSQVHSCENPLSTVVERDDYQEWSSSKDFSKMKEQYEMFVDAVGSNQVTV